MNNTVPLFKLRTKDPTDKNKAYIEVSNDKFQIFDMNTFYNEMGYSDEMRLNGVLPDEYIWETFVKNKDNRHSHSCYQLHIMSFLCKFSTDFVQKYDLKCRDWLAAEETMKASCADESCSDRKNMILSLTKSKQD
jgi:hypothetical protein